MCRVVALRYRQWTIGQPSWTNALLWKLCACVCACWCLKTYRTCKDCLQHMLPTVLQPRFYIQLLLYRPHFGTWILPFGLLGSKRKKSETTEFLLIVSNFLRWFLQLFVGKDFFLNFSKNILAYVVKSYITWS